MLDFARRVGFSVFALGAVVLALPLAAEDYPIGRGDEIDLSVFARPDLSRIYRVRPDGTISLHIVGTIQAAGRRPAELEEDIEARLATSFSDTESVTLEVTTYRPIIVSGDVETPGIVPFHAGIDVRSAVAIGGGLPDPVDLDDTGGRMRVSDEMANAAFQAARLATLEVTRARLIAARDGETTLDIPDTVTERVGEQLAAPLTGSAAMHLSAVVKERGVRANVQRDQVRLAGEEAEAFAERRRLLNEQLDTILGELAKQEDLRERGLARADRVVELTLDAARLRVDILESIGLEAAARQKLERAESFLVSEETGRRADLSETLAELEAAILETRARLDGARAFVREFGGDTALAGEGGLRVAYRVFRGDGDAPEVIEAAPDTRLRPGDRLEVTRMPILQETQ